MKRVASYLLTVVVAASLVPLATISPAGAVPPAPTLTAPTEGITVTSNPVLQWQATPATTKYRVQVDADPAFASPDLNVITFNTSYAHTIDLPLATLYWRVAGIDSANVQGSFSDARTFTKEAASGPTLSSPAEAASITYPDDPPVFTWLPFDGAKRYEIEIDSEPDFIPPLTKAATSTTNTSYALVAPPTIGQTFYWRVRAFSASSLPTQYSEVRSYSYTWPSVPELLSPENDNDPNEAIEQIEFEWSPSAGALTYDLQVSPNDQFTGTLSVNATSLHGTRYSPPVTLPAGPYYWRVRARNTAGGVGAWQGVPSTFYRAWPAPDLPPNPRVILESPTNGNLAVSIPVFEWTPVRLASKYQIDLGTDINFSPSTFDSCTTEQTTFIPVSSCNPAPGTVYYWRVKPLDGAINGLYSATSQFQYFPAVPTLVSPADGSNSLVGPVVLSWNAVPNIARYKVTVVRGANTVAETAFTDARSFVPQNLDPAEGPFKWYVQTVDSANRVGLLPNSGAWDGFNFTAPVPTNPNPDPLTPNGTTADHVPNLTWEPVAGATGYKIFTATPGSPVSNLFKSDLNVNSYTETGDAVNRLSTGTFEWYVEAYDNSNALISVGNVGTFTLEQMAPTVLTGPDHCPPNTNCTAVNVTPTFTWEWDPGATDYIVYFATDPNFSNITKTFTGVHFPIFRPVESLADAQAGQATYWYARPCYESRCGAQPSTFVDEVPPINWAFRKRSEPVLLTSPANGAEVANQIVFRWQDYLATNLAAAQPNDLEAANYVLTISTTIDMQSIVHTSPSIDQTTYTVYSETLPNGPLYWRVQAFDAHGNALTYSSETADPITPRLVNKTAPSVVLSQPTPNATVSGVPVFTWEAQDFAVKYELEVYKNTDQPLATSNRVLLISTPMTGWIPVTSLPSGLYGWRVRRLDADNLPGPWSAVLNTSLRKFTLEGNKVTLLSPADEASFPDDDQAFTWSPVAGAAQYRFQTSTTDTFATFVEQQTTVMTAWHSTIHYANGTYFWRVLTIDGAGNPTATSDTRTFVHGPPQPDPAYFHSIAPGRILDSRAATQVGPFGSPWQTGVSRNVEVAGFSGVPSDAVAVTLNVTVTGTTAGGFLQIWPKGEALPASSAINWLTGQTIANSVTVRVGADDSVTVRNHIGNTNVIVDVVGYYDDDSVTGDSFTPVTPVRLVDSRPGTPTLQFDSKWGQNVTRSVTVAGVAGSGIPLGANAVALNITATGGSAGSFLTVWPTGQPKPSTSSVNFSAGRSVPNAVTAKVGSNGRIQINNWVGTVDVIVDVVGYFELGVGQPFRPLVNPVRIQDSRPGQTQVGPYGTTWGANTIRTIQVVAETPANIPLSATAVLLNTTVTGTTAGSFLTVYPDGAALPTASNLNWVAGQTVANAVTVKLGTGGRIRVRNALGGTHVIMDAGGYYGP